MKLIHYSSMTVISLPASSSDAARSVIPPNDEGGGPDAGWGPSDDWGPPSDGGAGAPSNDDCALSVEPGNSA